MITSGCTGWEPNKARLLTAGSILGEWKQLPNPCIGEKADKTFGGQGTYIFPLQGKEDRFVLWQIAGVRRVCWIHVISGCLFNLMKRNTFY